MTEKMTIVVEGYEASQVQGWIDERIGALVTKGLEDKVTDAVESRATALVEELTRERIRKDIDAVLDEGWSKTDQWGNANGPKATLRDRIRGMLDTRASSYSNEGTFLEKWCKDAVTYQLGKVLEAELVDARKRLKTAFDEVLQAKFSNTIRDALGLK